MATTKGTARAQRAKATPKTGRLGKGDLQAMVLAHLKRHRGQEFTSGQVAKVLDRSSGAIGNALEKFAKDADSPVVRTSDAPRRYSIRKGKAKGGSRTKR